MFVDAGPVENVAYPSTQYSTVGSMTIAAPEPTPTASPPGVAPVAALLPGAMFALPTTAKLETGAAPAAEPAVWKTTSNSISQYPAVAARPRLGAAGV